MRFDLKVLNSRLNGLQTFLLTILTWNFVVVVLQYTTRLKRIQYAKTDSEVISKSKGSYGDKEKKKKDKKKPVEAQPGAAKKPAGAVCLFVPV